MQIKTLENNATYSWWKSAWEMFKNQYIQIYQICFFSLIVPAIIFAIINSKIAKDSLSLNFFMPLILSSLYFSLDSLKKGRFQLSNCFIGFKDSNLLKRLIPFSILLIISSLVAPYFRGNVLVVILVTIIGFYINFAIPLLAFNDISLKDAMIMSIIAVKNNIFPYSLFFFSNFLSMIFFLLLGTVGAFILVFFLLPMIILASYFAYCDIFQNDSIIS